MTRRVVRSEQGTTLVEMMVVVVILTGVMTSMFAVVSSMTNAEHRNMLAVENRHAVSQGLGELQRDVRAASSIVPAGSSGSAADELTVMVPDGSGGSRGVRFALDPDAHTLRRTNLDAGLSAPTSERQLLNDLTTDTKEPTFRYFASDGRELVAGVDPVDEIAQCSVRIETTVVRQLPGSANRISVSVDASPRNIRPEITTC